MNQKLLLREYTTISIEPELLKEFAGNPDKPVTVIGIIQRADSKNQNGRVYPYNIMKREVDRYLSEVVKKGVALGQLDHIDSPIIELKNVSHIIDDIWWGGEENKDVYGKIRLLDTPSGKIAKEMVKNGIPLGVSSRAIGSVSKNESKGEDVVGEDLQMICWDLVGTPSTHNAYLALHENFDPMKSLPTPARILATLKELLKK